MPITYSSDTFHGSDGSDAAPPLHLDINIDDNRYGTINFYMIPGSSSQTFYHYSVAIYVDVNRQYTNAATMTGEILNNDKIMTKLCEFLYNDSENRIGTAGTLTQSFADLIPNDKQVNIWFGCYNNHGSTEAQYFADCALLALSADKIVTTSAPVIQITNQWCWEDTNISINSDSICLNVSRIHGSEVTTWQKSIDGNTWVDIDGNGTYGQVYFLNLTADTEYTVYVRATNSAGSNMVQATIRTDAVLPEISDIINENKLNDDSSYSASTNSITVRSDRTGGTAATAWYLSTDGGVTWGNLTWGVCAFAGYAFVEALYLSPDTEYTVGLYAENRKGSTNAKYIIVKTLPNLPEILSLVQAAVTSNAIAFTATRNTDKLGSTATAWQYKLGNGNWVDTGRSDADSLGFTIGNLSDNTSYDIYVRAGNRAGWGEAKGPLTVTTAKNKPILGLIENTNKRNNNAGLSNSATSISISVSRTGGSTAESWEYSIDGGQKWNATNITDATSFAYTINNLSDDTSYNIHVRAKNSAGYSESVSTTIKTFMKVPVLNNLINENPFVDSSGTTKTGISKGTKSLKIKATRSGGSKAEKWYYAVGADKDNNKWTEMSGDGSSCTKTFTDLTPATTYTIWVKAYNAAGYSSAKNITIRTYSIPPVLTWRAKDAAISKLNSVTVYWESTLKIKNVQYKYKVEGEQYYGSAHNISLSTAAKSGQVTISGIEPGTKVYMIVYGQETVDDLWNNPGLEGSAYTYHQAYCDVKAEYIHNNGAIGFSNLNNPSGNGLTVKICKSDGTAIHSQSIANNATSISLTESEWDAVYKLYGSANNVTLKFRLITAADSGHSPSSYTAEAEFNCKLTGIQKTTHVGVGTAKAVKRAMVWYGSGKNIKHAVVWVGVGKTEKKPKRTI